MRHPVNLAAYGQYLCDCRDREPEANGNTFNIVYVLALKSAI
jgi:hypothetical protein